MGVYKHGLSTQNWEAWPQRSSVKNVLQTKHVKVIFCTFNKVYNSVL